MNSLAADLRFAFRRLSRTPGFAAIIVATLALGIGATTALFSIVNAVVLEPLPYPAADRLVFVSSLSPQGEQMPGSPQDLADYSNESHVFSGFAAIDAGENATLTRANGPAQRLNEARVGAGFFSVLGVQPAAGRFFVPGEDSASATKTVVLSDVAWHRYFGGDRAIVGQSITIDGDAYRVIGIARPGFDYPQGPDVWLPAVWRSFEIGDSARGYHAIVGVGRLADGVTIERARRALETVAARLAERFPLHDSKIGAFVDGLQNQLVGNVDHALWPMLGAVIVVLLIACANVANLLLVRATARQTEMAVRSALGAGRARIVRQLVTESMLLWVAGALLGMIVTLWILAAVVQLGPEGLPRLSEIAIDGRALGFAAGITVVTGLAFGLLPALHAARMGLAALIRAGGRGASAVAGRTRSALVLGEIALATVLLICAGLLIRSFERLTNADTGFRPNHLIVFDVALGGDRYRYDGPTNAFARTVESRLAALPGTKQAAVSADRPLDPHGSFGASASFTVDGEPAPKPGTEPEARIMPVSPSYFATLGVTLVRGRVFTESENRLDAAPTLVIDEDLARQYFPNENPIGKHVTFGLSHHVSANPADSVRMRGEIIGIIRHVVHGHLGEKTSPTAYFPFVPAPFGTTFLVRTDADVATVQREIRAVIHDIDPTAPVYELGTMDEAMSASVAQPRFFTLLLGSFSALALLLAALGIFGVISYAVGQRTREFGIRIALGASAPDVVRSVLRRGMALAVGGVLLGTVVAAGASRALASLLYGTGPHDVTSFVSAAAVLVVTAVVAAWVPARRAAAVDPVVAMRAE